VLALEDLSACCQRGFGRGYVVVGSGVVARPHGVRLSWVSQYVDVDEGIEAGLRLGIETPCG